MMGGNDLVINSNLFHSGDGQSLLFSITRGPHREKIRGMIEVSLRIPEYPASAIAYPLIRNRFFFVYRIAVGKWLRLTRNHSSNSRILKLSL